LASSGASLRFEVVLTFRSIPPAPKGIPQIEVSFDIECVRSIAVRV